MASLNMLVSELAHSVKAPNNPAIRENIKLLIIQTRNEVIRRSYENHGYVDKVLTQRFRVTLDDVNDGDVKILSLRGIDINDVQIKRTHEKVPRPVRLTNNLPFDRVSSVGYATNREFPYIKETSARFRAAVPGLCGMPCYDYINGYIYIFPAAGKSFDLNQIVIEGAFEHPNIIEIANGEDVETVLMDDNEYILSEDMIGQIKEIIYSRDLLTNIRNTNEIPTTNKVDL